MDAVPGVNPAREIVHLPHATDTLCSFPGFVISQLRQLLQSSAAPPRVCWCVSVPQTLGDAVDSIYGDTHCVSAYGIY